MSDTRLRKGGGLMLELDFLKMTGGAEVKVGGAEVKVMLELESKDFRCRKRRLKSVLAEDIF